MRKRFAAIPIAAARVRQLGGVAQVYIALAGHADKEGRAFPSVARLAEETGLHHRTVQRAIAALCAAGLLEKEERPEEAGDSNTNLYTVLPNIQQRGVADLPPPHGEVTTPGVATVTTPGVAHRAIHTKPLNRPLNTVRARARDGIAPGAPAKDDREHQLRIEACLRHGCAWPPEWGDTPAELLAAAA